MTIQQYYAEDHDRLDVLFKQFQALKLRDLPKAREAFQEFKQGLERHIAWEEEILFPLFEEKTGMAGVGPTEVMRMEHRQIKQLLQTISQEVEQKNSPSGSEEASLLEVLGAHNQKEEMVLYPAIDQRLTDPELQEVFTKMERIGCLSRHPKESGEWER